MKWGIIADSSSDILACHVDFNGIGFDSVPLKLITDDKEYIDDENLNIEELLSDMKKSGKSSSACPNVAEFREAMMKYDNCICFTVTGALSGSCNAACIARQMVLEEHPEKNIRVIDSRGAAGIIELSVRYAARLIEEGLSFEETAERTEKYCHDRRIVITLSTYDNLIKNGKMSPITGLVASVLGIKAVSVFNEQGEIVAKNKVRGDDKSLCAMLDIIGGNGGLDGRDIVITHCKNEAMAKKLEEKAKARWNVGDVRVRTSRGLVTYYAMPGGLVLSY